MTYDYGINLFVFTEDYESTPDLLIEGGCMIQIRQHLRKNWADRIFLMGRRARIIGKPFPQWNLKIDFIKGRNAVTPCHRLLLIVLELCCFEWFQNNRFLFIFTNKKRAGGSFSISS